MHVEWLTPEEIGRAKNALGGAIRSLRKDESYIAANRFRACYSGASVYTFMVTNAVSAAIFSWLLYQDPARSREYFHIAGESSVKLMELDRPEPVKVVYLRGRFYFLKRKGDKWVYRTRSVQEMLEQTVPDMDDVFEGQIPDLDSEEPIVFMHHFARLADRAITSLYDSGLGMEAAVSSGDMSLAARAAELACTLGDFGAQKTYAWYARAVKYTILGDDPSAGKCLQKLGETSKRAPYHDLGKAYTALLDGDRAGVEREFRAYLKWFEKKRKPEPVRHRDPETDDWVVDYLIDPPYLLSVSGLAFCNLAASRGMKLEVDELFLPRQLLAY